MTCLINVWTTPALKDKIDDLAEAVGRSRSAVLRALMKGATLDTLPSAWTKVRRDERLYLKEIES